MLLTQKRILQILSRHNHNDLASKLCDLTLGVLILLNITAVTLESVPQIGARFHLQFYYFEILSISIFTIEYVTRIWVSGIDVKRKGNTNFKRRLSYLFSFTGIVDLISILPSILFMFNGLDLRWMRVLRLIRLLKFSHYSPALESLTAALKAERNSFTAAIYLFLIALFFSSALMYMAEHDTQPEIFTSIPETIWWSLITLTTVGYGDVTPITTLGKIIGGFTAVMGVFVVALLTGIVATAFSSQISTSKQIIEFEIASALNDGGIKQDELEKIYILKRELNLSDEYVNILIKLLSEKSN